MNRKTFGIDRALAVLVAVLLLLGGIGVLLWALDLLPSQWGAPSRFTLGVPEVYSDDPWWPWAMGLAGLILTAVGTAWFVSHFRVNRVSTLSLAGADEGGQLLLDASALGNGVAAALEEASPGITGANGKVVEQRRNLVLDVTATVRRQADLREVARACDDVTAHLLDSIGREDLACRIRLKVAGRDRAASRVH